MKLKKNLERIDVVSILENAFRVCGLYSFNAINFSKFFKRENINTLSIQPYVIRYKDHSKFLAYVENILGSEIITMFKRNKDDE